MTISSVVRTDTRQTEYTFGNFQMLADGTLLHGEEIIHLPPKELTALRFLLNHAGEVVTRVQLKRALWGDVNVTPDSVPRCLSSLRARLETEQSIQTVYKRGYRFVGPVRYVGAPIKSRSRLAIMPFAVGPHVALHLGPTIAEEVTACLTEKCPPSVLVLARDSVFTLARRGLTAAQVGETLKADLVLTATLFSLPTHYRLRAEMIRVEDGVQIWIEDLLVANSRVAALQSELIQQLLFRLGTHDSISLEAGAHALQSASSRPEAYELFLRGRYEWQSCERHRMQDGMQHLIRATELDTTLLSAHVDLANVCVGQELYGFLSPEVAAKEIRRIAACIPDVACNAPKFLPTMGWYSFHVDRDMAAALEMFSLSTHLPHDPWTTRLRVMFAVSRHRFDEALEWLRAALAVDPYAPWLHARLAWTHHLAGDAQKSVEQIEKSLNLFPDHESNRLYGSVILAYNGYAARAAELAEELARRTPYFDIATAVRAYALARDEHRDEAHSLLERLQWLSRGRFVLSSFTAAAYAELGDEQGAIDELLAADRTRCPWFFQTLADPRLKSLRGHSQFKKMLAALNEMEASVANSLECLF
ncbi:MAG TPA: winged helix-turn-helix domain-containing protein [Terracidiphilus sp.]|jgi:DNA-binding winged helix-turn-helix (wHTH) protein/tetratricopeptide (TPR) repeat protein